MSEPMMKKFCYNVVVFRYEFNYDFLNMKFVSVEDMFTKLQNNVKQILKDKVEYARDCNYKDFKDASFDGFNIGDKYNFFDREGNLPLTLYFSRLETDKEMKARLKKEEKERVENENKKQKQAEKTKNEELKILKRLQAKYGKME